MSGISVISWRCSCAGDPVAESAKDVIAAILKRAPNDTQRSLLQSAQQTLVRRVCESCWRPGLEEILWVQTYIEPQERLDETLRCTLGSYVSDDWYLHRAADIAGTDGSAVEFYDKVLVPRIKDVRLIPEKQRREKWISNILAKASSPPFVQFWLEDGKVCSSPSIGEIHNLYTCLFDNSQGRQDGVYLHVSYPGRGTELSEYVGPAGSYLFLKSYSRVTDVPPCLMFHLRAFVQALVTAQLWALSQHLMEDLRRASEPFALHHGHFRTFLKAAEDIMERVDPLHLDVSELYELKDAASPVFEARDPSGNERFHSFSQVESLKDQDKGDLEKLLSAFGESVTNRSSDVAALVAMKFATWSCLKKRWLLARACYKLTISFGLLVENEELPHFALWPFSTATTGTDEEKKRLELNFRQHLAIAAMQIAKWKRGPNGDKYCFSYSDAGGQKRITINPPESDESNLDDLLSAAKAYVGSTRHRADGGGNQAREWARVIRGLAGTNWVKFKEKIKVENRSVVFDIGLPDFRK